MSTTDTNEGKFSWPKPYLLRLYEQAVEQGCIRIRMQRGGVEEYRSLKAAFHRMRRRKDGDFLVLMRPEYQHCTMRWEEQGTALIIYDALPDGELLPEIEAVDGKTKMEQPIGAMPHQTPDAEPVEDFDSQALVAGLIGKLNLEDDDEPASEL